MIVRIDTGNQGIDLLTGFSKIAPYCFPVQVLWVFQQRALTSGLTIRIQGTRAALARTAVPWNEPVRARVRDCVKIAHSYYPTALTKPMTKNKPAITPAKRSQTLNQ